MSSSQTGKIESGQRDLTVRVNRSYESAADFRALVIKKRCRRHGDPAWRHRRCRTRLANDKVMFRGNGVPQIGLGIVKQSTANTLESPAGIKAEVERIRQTLPMGWSWWSDTTARSSSRSRSIRSYHTLTEAMAIVVCVIFLFLGSVRAALIRPSPCRSASSARSSMLYAMGGTINLLTLLALVLAIGHRRR
jgi:multidrug efflux pump